MSTLLKSKKRRLSAAHSLRHYITGKPAQVLLPILLLLTIHCGEMSTIASDDLPAVVEIHAGEANWITGTLHPKTDDNYVWIRVELGSTVVIRPIPRATIVSMRRLNRPSQSPVNRDRRLSDAQRAKRALFDPSFARSS